MAYPHSVTETLADGCVHLAGLVCVGLAVAYATSTMAPSAVWIYIACAGTAFTLSALYHMSPLDGLRPIFHRLDHAAIYFKIAGTYTPLVVLIGSMFSYVLLGLVWVIAVAGALAKLTVWATDAKGSLALYLALGWLAVSLSYPIVTHLGWSVLGLIAAGGALYSIGAIFFAHPGFRFQNALWHSFVLSASICFFLAIALAQDRSQRIEITAHAGLHMAEPVAAQMLAAVPPRDHHEVI